MTVTIRPRRDWQDPAQPVVGPAAVLGAVTMLPAHYTAAATVPDDTAAYLRSIQRDYTVNRGYSIGYNFAVDRAGVAWECRGFDIKCAANKGMNDVTLAILCLVDGAAAMSPVMVDTFRGLGAEAQRRVRADLLVVGHRDIGATACPGDGIYHQVVTGQLEPGDPAPTPTPPDPDPDLEDDDVTAFLLTNPATGEVAVVYGAGLFTGLDGGAVPGLSERLGPPTPVADYVWADFQSKSTRLLGP